MILGEIKKLFREGGTVKVSRSLKELGLRVNAAREHHRKLCGTEPTLSQLAEELGESVENITLAIQAAQPALSLTPEGENSDRQIDIPVESPEEELADKIGLAEVLESLPEEDRLLIRLRFYANRTQSETAKVCIPRRYRSPGGAQDSAQNAGAVIGMSREKENRAFLEKCKKRACFLSESVLEYITVRRMSDTNASEKADEK